MPLLMRILCRNCQKLYKSRLRQQTNIMCRWNSESVTEEMLVPTTFNKLEIPDSAPMINGYTTQGFVINGNTVYGSVALLPRGMVNWKVTSCKDLVVEKFVLFYLLHPKIDLIVLGTGSKIQRIEPKLFHNLKKKGINLEVQDTPNACATFNFLLSEGRPTGAALIPPDHISP